MSKKTKVTETEPEVEALPQSDAPTSGQERPRGTTATAQQVTTLVASLLTSPRYASSVKDEAEQERVVGIALGIAEKINRSVQ